MSILNIGKVIPLMMFILWANLSFAHQQKSAETTMLISKDAKTLEVSHRFYLHDTEHAVHTLFDKKADILNSKETQQQFADYVAKQFLVRSLDDKPLALSEVGYETEGKFFWVYQEVELPEELPGLKLYNGSLRDLWPTQINMVNIEGKGNIRTLYFDKNQDWLEVSF
ncbi:hypothetical protein GCM10009111_12370 [Colwellia asteriadis]|uniref:Orphan protein n=1 Tax=Colwellia asteriadis TaxID=517723 RepID=A0ABN1L5G3_9GAMM